MAFVKKTWKDRLVEFAGRRTLKRVSGSADSTLVVDVSRNEGTVSQVGDAFSAANMNDLEQRISDEFSALNNDLGGCSLEQEGENFFIIGADSVRKKLGSGGKCTFNITATQSGQSILSDNYYGEVNGTTSMIITVDFETKTVIFNSRSQTGTVTHRFGKDPGDGPYSASVTGSQSISNVSWIEQ